MRVSIGFLGFCRLFLSGFLYEAFYWAFGFWRLCVFIWVFCRVFAVLGFRAFCLQAVGIWVRVWGLGV